MSITKPYWLLIRFRFSPVKQKEKTKEGGETAGYSTMMVVLILTGMFQSIKRFMAHPADLFPEESLTVFIMVRIFSVFLKSSRNSLQPLMETKPEHQYYKHLFDWSNYCLLFIT